MSLTMPVPLPLWGYYVLLAMLMVSGLANLVLVCKLQRRSRPGERHEP